MLNVSERPAESEELGGVALKWPESYRLSYRKSFEFAPKTVNNVGLLRLLLVNIVTSVCLCACLSARVLYMRFRVFMLLSLKFCDEQS